MTHDGGSLTSSGFAPPGAPIAARVQPPNDQLDVFVVGDDERLYVIWEVDNGPWQEPVALSEPVFVPGSTVRAISWPAIQMRALALGSHVMQATAYEDGAWQSSQPLV